MRSFLLASPIVVATCLVLACNGGDDPPASPATTPDASSDANGNGTDSGATSSDAAVPSGPFSFTAAAPDAPPPDAKVVVVWSVTSGSPDYLYAHGGGSAAGTEVDVSFSTSPPAEALNGGKLGIGVILLMNEADAPPEGKVDSDQLDLTKALAAAPDYAVIFRNSTEGLLKSGWDTSFPLGYACGRCERTESGKDTFVTVDCSSVEVVPYSKNLEFCDWT